MENYTISLEQRFTQFSKDVILFCRNLKTDTVTRPLISQVVRSATSIGANYAESQSGVSTKDFRIKVAIAKKEAQETRYWFKLLKTCYPERINEIDALFDETTQICKILQTILNKSK